MTDIDYLDLKQFVKNVSIDDIGFLKIVDNVIKDIAKETKVFKKLYSFTTFKDLEIYDLNWIANINERTKKNVIDFTINEPTVEEILEFIQNGASFSDYVSISETDEEASGYISLIDVQILEEDLSISNNFIELEGFNFKYKHMLKDSKQYLFEATIAPSRSNIDYYQFDIIKQALIEGLKYHILDDVTDAKDGQIANTYYMRYFNEKRKIFNMLPERKRIRVERLNSFSTL